MALDGLNNSDFRKATEAIEAFKASAPQGNNKIEELKSKLIIKMPGGKATTKVSEKDVEKALNEPSPHKAIKGLLEKSPIGKQEKLQDMGYEWHGTAYHPSAPTIYKSSDGGTVTVYPGGGTAEMGEDKRKTVYENGRFKQEMYYDEKGNLTGGKIIIKDNIAGFTERQIDFTMDKDGKMIVSE